MKLQLMDLAQHEEHIPGGVMANKLQDGFDAMSYTCTQKAHTSKKGREQLPVVK